MTLEDAIRAHSKSLVEASVTYKEQVIAVNTLVNGVLTSQLPTLNGVPPDWQDFVNAYVASRTDALDWVNQVLSRLLEVPDDVMGFNANIVALLNDAEAQATTLVNDPSNQNALAALKQDLNMVLSRLALVTSFISGAVTSVRNFQNKMPDLAAQLQTITTRSINAANADKAKIDDLNNKIKTLHDDIKSLTAAIIGLSIADGIALTLGIVATIALFPVGALVWFMLGPAVAAATTFIALDAIKIENDKNAIAAAEKALTGISADVSTLQILSTSYAKLADESQAVEAALQAILAEWQNLESDVVQAVTALQTALAESGQQAYAQALVEIQGAVNAWNEADAQAADLELVLEVNTAQLDPGMSSQQVQQALAGGDSMGVIAYFDQVGPQP
jgi:hypothetical protein